MFFLYTAPSYHLNSSVSLFPGIVRGIIISPSPSPSPCRSPSLSHSHRHCWVFLWWFSKSWEDRDALLEAFCHEVHEEFSHRAQEFHMSKHCPISPTANPELRWQSPLPWRTGRRLALWFGPLKFHSYSLSLERDIIPPITTKPQVPKDCLGILHSFSEITNDRCVTLFYWVLLCVSPPKLLNVHRHPKNKLYYPKFIDEERETKEYSSRRRDKMEGCMRACVHAHAEARGWCPVVFFNLSSLDIEQGFSLEPRAHQSHQLASGIPCLCLLLVGITGRLPQQPTISVSTTGPWSSYLRVKPFLLAESCLTTCKAKI